MGQALGSLKCPSFEHFSSLGLHPIEKRRSQARFTDPGFAFQQRYLRLTAGSLLIEGHEAAYFRPSSNKGDVEQRSRGRRAPAGPAVRTARRKGVAQHLCQGDIPRARFLLEAGLKRHQQLGDQQGQTLIYALLAQAAASEHDFTLTRTLAVQSLELARSVRDTGSLILCLEELADVVAGQGEPEWATVLWGAAERYREV